MKTSKSILTLVLIFTSTFLWSQPYVGEIKLFAGHYAPVGWEICDGRLLPISEYETLFTLIGITYGGDGQSTFALPDLRGRVPISNGANANGVNFSIGTMTGSEEQTLTMNNIPSHTHLAQFMLSEQRATHAIPTSSSTLTTTGLSSGRSFRPNNSYNDFTGTVLLDSFITESAGSNTPISIVKPYLTITYIISLYGVFPTPQ